MQTIDRLHRRFGLTALNLLTDLNKHEDETRTSLPFTTELNDVIRVYSHKKDETTQ